MHVVGVWMVADDRSLCVDVHAMYPALDMRREERRVIVESKGLTRPSISAS